MVKNYILCVIAIVICGCAVITPSGQTFMYAPGNSNNYVLVNCDSNFSGQTASDCDQMIYEDSKFDSETNAEFNGTVWLNG